MLGFPPCRGLAATTIDRRLSTVCGFYRFAHIDGRIASNPAQYVRRPKVHPNDASGLDRSDPGSSAVAAAAATAAALETTTVAEWRARATNTPSIKTALRLGFVHYGENLAVRLL